MNVKCRSQTAIRFWCAPTSRDAPLFREVRWFELILIVIMYFVRANDDSDCMEKCRFGPLEMLANER